MSFVTVLIEYEKKEDSPAFKANMEALGGIVKAVNFGDLFADIERCEAELQELDDETRC